MCQLHSDDDASLVRVRVSLVRVMMMMFITISARDQSSKGRRRIWAFDRRSGRASQQRYSRPLPALSHWEVKLGEASMEEMWGAGFAGSSPPFLRGLDENVGSRQRTWVRAAINFPRLGLY